MVKNMTLLIFFALTNFMQYTYQIHQGNKKAA